MSARGDVKSENDAESRRVCDDDHCGRHPVLLRLNYPCAQSDAMGHAIAGLRLDAQGERRLLA